jgi:hypothetical protein
MTGVQLEPGFGHAEGNKKRLLRRWTTAQLGRLSEPETRKPRRLEQISRNHL